MSHPLTYIPTRYQYSQRKGALMLQRMDFEVHQIFKSFLNNIDEKAQEEPTFLRLFFQTFNRFKIVQEIWLLRRQSKEKEFLALQKICDEQRAKEISKAKRI